MQKILVTGANGFVGRHLVRELSDANWGVAGLGREKSPLTDIQDDLEDYISCDLTDLEMVRQIPLQDVRAIINLAGLAAVGKSFDNPELYMQINVNVLTNLCEHVKKSCRPDIRIIAVSTGAVYDPHQEMPLREDSLTTPASSPYAASKLAMEEAAVSYSKAGLDCIVVRPFNHIGPGQEQGFLLPDLYSKIQSLVPGQYEIRVGNIATQRDYTDVRDVAKAYIALATADQLGYSLYNVCSGKPVSGEHILEILKKVTNKDSLKTIVDKDLFRPSDAPILYGDNTRLQIETGWKPVDPLEQTISDFVIAADS